MSAVTVFCSSSSNLDPRFHEIARRTGTSIATHGLVLVYGGGGVGLMGEVARAAKTGGANVVGVTTRRLMAMEQAWSGCDDLIVVDTMRERKRLLEAHGDAFLVLPGGLGTYEELFEMLVARVLGDHDKPIGIVNADGYYNPLVAMVEHGIEHRFIHERTRDLFRIDPDADAVLDALRSELGAREPAT